MLIGFVIHGFGNEPIQRYCSARCPYCPQRRPGRGGKHKFEAKFATRKCPFVRAPWNESLKRRLGTSVWRAWIFNKAGSLFCRILAIRNRSHLAGTSPRVPPLQFPSRARPLQSRSTIFQLHEPIQILATETGFLNFTHDDFISIYLVG